MNEEYSMLNTDNVEKAMYDYNALLRSAYQVANRQGENTNWPAFANQLQACLEKHHATWMELCWKNLHEPTA